ncbi:hypothetical protein DFH09DRAFT_1108865 [Mycena vulgaris]|nr:hypothetical protein DFH09DRAFT_1108865 [Mycena vulgaris]
MAKGKRAKRQWRRKAKEERKSNKLWAEGAREEFLKKHVEAYADALELWMARRTRLSSAVGACSTTKNLELPLADYDPFAPAVPEVLTDQEKQQRYERIEELNVRICRWLKYRARSLRRNLARGLNARDNPYAVLLAKLTGVSAPPKARQAFQQFMHESYQDKISSVVATRWAAESIGPDSAAKSGKPNTPFRCKIAREMFLELPEVERTALQERATAEARAAKAAYAGASNGGSAGGESSLRQGLEGQAFKVSRGASKLSVLIVIPRCIDTFGRFIAPIMKGLQEYTGLHGLVILGGPMPKYNGELGTVHLAVSRNLAPTPLYFPNWDKARFNKDVVEFMKSYLATAFKQISEAALAPGPSLAGAKYTFEPDAKEDDESSDDESSSDNSDSDSDSDSESGSESAGAAAEKKRGKKGNEKGKEKEKEGKKRKRGVDGEEGASRTKKSKSAPARDSPPPHPQRLGSDIERARESAIRRNQELLRALDLANASKHLAPAPAKPRPKPRMKPKAGDESAPRRSQRLGGGDEDVEMQDVQGSGQPATLGEPLAQDSADADNLRALSAAASAPPTTPAPDTQPTPTVDDTPGLHDGGAPAPAPIDTSAPDKGPTPDNAHTVDRHTPAPAHKSPPLSPDTPEWFRNMYRELVHAELAPAYNRLLSAYIELERGYGYDNTTGGKLGAANRHKQVGKWIQDARGRSGKTPSITSVAAFEKSWWAWWSRLQPASQAKDAEGSVLPVTGGRGARVGLAGHTGGEQIIECDCGVVLVGECRKIAREHGDLARGGGRCYFRSRGQNQVQNTGEIRNIASKERYNTYDE